MTSYQCLDQDVRDELDQQIREFCKQRLEKGNSYVNVRRIGKEIDATPQALGHSVTRLVEAGDLEVWRDVGNARTTYEITINE